MPRFRHMEAPEFAHKMQNATGLVAFGFSFLISSVANCVDTFGGFLMRIPEVGVTVIAR
jgi:hypothetical protein